MKVVVQFAVAAMSPSPLGLYGFKAQGRVDILEGRRSRHAEATDDTASSASGFSLSPGPFRTSAGRRRPAPALFVCELHSFQTSSTYAEDNLRRYSTSEKSEVHTRIALVQ